MILLAYILQGHPEWDEASISVFFLHDGDKAKEEKTPCAKASSRDACPSQNKTSSTSPTKEFCADDQEQIGRCNLVILGFNQRDIETMGEDAFERFNGLGEILFVHGLKPLVLQ